MTPRASCCGCPAPRRVPRPSAAGPRPPPRSAPRRRALSHQGRRGRGHEDPTAWESCSPPALIETPSACAPGYVPTLLLRMTHQGHSATTFTCGFTHPGGNDSGKPPRSCRQSGNDAPQESHPHLCLKNALPLTSHIWVQGLTNPDTGSFRLRPRRSQTRVEPAYYRSNVLPDHPDDPASVRAASVLTPFPPTQTKMISGSHE